MHFKKRSLKKLIQKSLFEKLLSQNRSLKIELAMPKNQKFHTFCLLLFYNISFYTQPVYFFHPLREFCNVHDHIVFFFSFLERS